MAARGMRAHTLLQLKKGTSTFWSGQRSMAARGTIGHVLLQRKEATSRSCSGRGRMAARGTRGHALKQRKEAVLQRHFQRCSFRLAWELVAAIVPGEKGEGGFRVKDKQSREDGAT